MLIYTFYVDKCSSSRIKVKFVEMSGTGARDLEQINVSGTDGQKDSACCRRCYAMEECQYWVREKVSGSARCWIKTNANKNEVTCSYHKQRRGGIKE